MRPFSVWAWLGFLWALVGVWPAAAKVTLITHGLNGTTTGWVAGMAQAMTNRPGGPADAAIYRLQFNSSLVGTFTKLSGPSPLASVSGEIIILLDWGPVAGGNSYNTAQVAAAVLPFLTATNSLAELGGRALVSWPLHLIGHSRGGSLVCELGRLLGEQGVWVDHITTLDAHPLNNDGFNDFIYSATDVAVKTCENVLFADSYWQSTSFVRGLAVPGAYARRQTNFSGGYTDSLSGPHSDVHLWYHATIAGESPVSDGEVSISAANRALWFGPLEQLGTNAGYQFTLRETGDRQSAAQPGGTTSNRVRDGYNQRFDFGLGATNNRTILATNAGHWPNPIRFELLVTNPVPAEATLTARIWYQWARPASSNLAVAVLLDADTNPYNGNEQPLISGSASGTGTLQVGDGFIELPLTNAPYVAESTRMFIRLTTPDGRERFLHAPQRLSRLPPFTSPTLDLVSAAENTLRLGINGAAGQTLVIEFAEQPGAWTAFATQTLSAARWELTVTNVGSAGFFRARQRP
jgi:hypothetical protein